MTEGVHKEGGVTEKDGRDSVEVEVIHKGSRGKTKRTVSKAKLLFAKLKLTMQS